MAAMGGMQRSAARYRRLLGSLASAGCGTRMASMTGTAKPDAPRTPGFRGTAQARLSARRRTSRSVRHWASGDVRCGHPVRTRAKPAAAGRHVGRALMSPWI